jgi:para-aminobenzoate synthetase
VRAALRRGDSYQLCLTYPIALRFDGDALLLYARLRLENPAPFSAFVSAPFGAIASSSPERFLRVGRDGRVEARPMKGTAARAADAGERERAARELVASEKARAENLMIADLLRNDLGRVCRLGSVRAARPALLEEHATVLQLVSVIEGELLPGRTRADLLASAFPPGSMTGAPKTRSIELLRDLELEPRGPYSGALGYVAADGRMDLSVLIRAVLLAGGSARVNVGGGIVWDSTARGEFEESRLKAEPLLRALASATAADRGGDGALSGCATSERAATARAPARDASARSAS